MMEVVEQQCSSITIECKRVQKCSDYDMWPSLYFSIDENDA